VVILSVFRMSSLLVTSPLLKTFWWQFCTQS